MSYFLDLPLSWNPVTLRLLDMLTQAYPTVDEVRDLAQDIGLELGTIAEAATARGYLRNVMDAAWGSLKQRPLVDRVRDDPLKAQWRAELDELLALEPPAPVPTGGSILGATTWELIGRLLRRHVLEGEVETSLRTFLAADFVESQGFGRGVDDGALLLRALKQAPVGGPDPPLVATLEKLLSLVPEQDPAAETLRLALVWTERRRGVQADPLQQQILTGGYLFLNRHSLRDELEALASRDGPVVLTINGERQVGKTHCVELIRHIEETRGIEVAYCHIDDVGSPAGLVRWLSRILGIEVSAEDSADKWSRLAALDLVVGARKGGGNWWFVLDGFNKDRLDSRMREMILSLARMIGRETSSRLRLVLLDFQDSLPDRLRRRIRARPLSPLQESDVREFFVHFFSTPRPGLEEWPQSDEEVDTYVELVVSEVWTKIHHEQGEPAPDLVILSVPEGEEWYRKPFMRRLAESVEEVVDGYA